MPVSDLTDPHTVEQAIAEADWLGAAAFRTQYGFERATKYLLAHRGKLYDSKAILNVAIGIERGLGRPVVSGSARHAAGRLAELGFLIVQRKGARLGPGDPGRHYIYYWRAYREDVATGPLLQLNQSSEAMAEIAPGDTVWAVTNNGPGSYALAARFLVGEAGINAPGSAGAEWGDRYFRAAPDRVVYFEVEAQPDISDLLRDADLVKPGGNAGQAFQGGSGVRLVIGNTDPLLEHARRLVVDRALTTPSAIEEWRADEAAVPSPLEADTPARREYRREMVVRSRKLVADLKALYGGECQLSGGAPLGGLVGDITEAHHIHWLTRGGLDTRDNLVILSLDWHAAVHAGDTRFDWSDLSFVINGRRFPLLINRHLKPRSPKLPLTAGKIEHSERASLNFS